MCMRILTFSRYCPHYPSFSIYLPFPSIFIFSSPSLAFSVIQSLHLPPPLPLSLYFHCYTISILGSLSLSLSATHGMGSSLSLSIYLSIVISLSSRSSPPTSRRLSLQDNHSYQPHRLRDNNGSGLKTH